MLPRGHLSDIHLPNNQIADCPYRRISWRLGAGQQTIRLRPLPQGGI